MTLAVQPTTLEKTCKPLLAGAATAALLAGIFKLAHKNPLEKAWQLGGAGLVGAGIGWFSLPGGPFMAISKEKLFTEIKDDAKQEVKITGSDELELTFEAPADMGESELVRRALIELNKNGSSAEGVTVTADDTVLEAFDASYPLSHPVVSGLLEVWDATLAGGETTSIQKQTAFVEWQAALVKSEADDESAVDVNELSEQVSILAKMAAREGTFTVGILDARATGSKGLMRGPEFTSKSTLGDLLDDIGGAQATAHSVLLERTNLLTAGLDNDLTFADLGIDGALGIIVVDGVQ